MLARLRGVSPWAGRTLFALTPCRLIFFTRQWEVFAIRNAHRLWSVAFGDKVKGRRGFTSRTDESAATNRSARAARRQFSARTLLLAETARGIVGAQFPHDPAHF